VGTKKGIYHTPPKDHLDMGLWKRKIGHNHGRLKDGSRASSVSADSNARSRVEAGCVQNDSATDR
jgi:hypothetical protein